MYVIYHVVRACRVAHGHHGKRRHEEEGQYAQRPVAEELRPEVNEPHVGSLVVAHHHTLPRLAETEEHKRQTCHSVNSHCRQPCVRRGRGVHLPVGRQLGQEHRDAIGHGQSAGVCQQHPHRCEYGYLVGVTSERGIQGSVRHVYQSV